jgi:hypothetical protein
MTASLAAANAARQADSLSAISRWYALPLLVSIWLLEVSFASFFADSP